MFTASEGLCSYFLWNNFFGYGPNSNLGRYLKIQGSILPGFISKHTYIQRKILQFYHFENIYVHTYSKIQIMNFPTPGKKHTDRHTPSRHSHWWWPIRNEFGSHVMPGICSMPVTHEAQSRRNRGEGIWCSPLPDLGRSVNPIQTRGADYPHHINKPPSGFSDLPTAMKPHCIQD